MLPYEKINWLHVELTTKCNAWCPGCARNNFGYGLKEGLTLQSLPPKKFNEVLSKLPNIKTIQMCGTYGDPIASEWFKEIVSICVDKKFNIRIHTNGSLKTVLWWEELAHTFKETNHMIIFGIDGLADTHSLYRQGTNFNKIIANATAFINAGGNAEWQFLLFKHNKHQVKDCMRLSQKIGFKKFTVKKSIRIWPVAKNFITGEDYIIEADDKYASSLDNSIKDLTVDDCMHLSYPSIYLNADGTLAPCCYLIDLPYEKNSIDTEISKNKATVQCKKNCGKVITEHKN